MSERPKDYAPGLGEHQPRSQGDGYTEDPNCGCVLTLCEDHSSITQTAIRLTRAYAEQIVKAGKDTT